MPNESIQASDLIASLSLFVVWSLVWLLSFFPRPKKSETEKKVVCLDPPKKEETYDALHLKKKKKNAGLRRTGEQALQ